LLFTAQRKKKLKHCPKEKEIKTCGSIVGQNSSVNSFLTIKPIETASEPKKNLHHMFIIIIIIILLHCNDMIFLS